MILKPQIPPLRFIAPERRGWSLRTKLIMGCILAAMIVKPYVGCSLIAGLGERGPTITFGPPTTTMPTGGR